MPIWREGQVIGAVVVRRFAGRAGSTRSRSFKPTLIWIGVVAAGLAASALFLAWRVTGAPLEEMRRAAERFARGELGFKLIVPDTEELAGLAEALNQMSEQLQERISTIVRQNNEQQAVLSSMVEGVLAVDNQQRVISLNKASGQLLGIDQMQAQGRSLQEVVRNADLRRFVSRALHARTPIDDDVVFHGDHEGVLQARGAALHDAQGREHRRVVVLNDVTDFRRLEHIRRDFVANVSHELKTPITSIKGFVETLLDGAIRQPGRRRAVFANHRQAGRSARRDHRRPAQPVEDRTGRRARRHRAEPGRVKDVIDAAIHICQHKADRAADPRLHRLRARHHGQR